ncbi:hypothetical protein HanRHA438_Chr16g0780221 [Helianthus annuus]|nr:hypothetical protein HanRHA438_Chr16g0780221 [Helianthus annuus]
MQQHRRSLPPHTTTSATTQSTNGPHHHYSRSLASKIRSSWRKFIEILKVIVFY